MQQKNIHQTIENICAARDLSDRAARVAIRLAQYQGQNSHAWPTVETLARACGMDTRKCQRALAELKTQGWLIVHQPSDQRARHKSSTYALTGRATAAPANVRADAPPGDKSVTRPGDKSVTHKSPMKNPRRVASATNPDSNSKERGPGRPKPVCMPVCWRSARWGGQWYSIYREEGAAVAFEIVHGEFMQMCRRKGIASDAKIIERSWRGFCRSKAA